MKYFVWWNCGWWSSAEPNKILHFFKENYCSTAVSTENSFRILISDLHFVFKLLKIKVNLQKCRNAMCSSLILPPESRNFLTFRWHFLRLFYNILITVVGKCVKAFSKVKMLLYSHRSMLVMTEMFLKIDKKLNYTCSQKLHNVMWKPKRAFDIRIVVTATF